jgi:PmbA protein
MVFEKYSNCRDQISLSIASNKLESIRKKHIIRTGVRVYKDGIIGIAGVVGSYEEDQLKQKACEALDLKLPYPCEPSQNHSEHIHTKCNYMDDEKFLSDMEGLIEEINYMCPDFNFSGKIDKMKQKTELKNDVKLDLTSEETYIKSQILIKHKDSKNIFDASVKYEKRNYQKKDHIMHISRICKAINNDISILPSGRYPIIFDKNSELLFSKLLSELNGIKFAMKTSLFSTVLDKRIFNPKFSLCQSLNPEDSTSPFFDAEGVVNDEYRYPLIEEGIILTPYTDKRTASLYKLPHTGSASGDYDGIPILRAKPFKVKETSETLKKLLAGKIGIYPILIGGSNFDAEGNFDIPIQMALIFDGENFLGRLPELQVRTNIYEMFGSGFIGASKDGYLAIELSATIL